jgi:hypothetical protein
MLSITVADVLIGTRYVSGSRNLEGKIVHAEKVDYSDTYKIEVMGDEYPRSHFWATIEVTTD